MSRRSRGRHGRGRGPRVSRRRLLGGLVALAGAGTCAGLLDAFSAPGPAPTGGPPAGASPSSSPTSSTPPTSPTTAASHPDQVLTATRGGTTSGSATTTSFVSRPDLAPPRVLLDTDRPGQETGLVVTECHGGQGQQGPLLIGPGGHLVWFHPVSDGGSTTRRTMNVRVQTYRGRPVLTYFEGAVVDGHGQGVYHLLDDRYRLIKTLHGHNGLMGDLHEFVLTPKGTALFTAYGTATADLSAVGGSTSGQYFYGEVQEVDVATGKLLFSWRSDHHVAFSESYYALPKNGTPWDYFHINSINVDPSDGNLIVSSRCTWTAYKVERTSGKVLWRLGGKKSDFSIGAGAQFAWQHDVTPLADGNYTIFDNQSGGPPGKPSRGLLLGVDEKARTVTLVRQYGHNPALYSGVLGSVQTLPDRHRFVGWGTTTYFTEYQDDGSPLLDGHLDGKGLESYRAFKSPWTATPTERPAVVARRSGGATTAYVSWNGATEVARWRVHAGSSPADLAAVGVAPTAGFETVITVPGGPTHVQVDALDAGGRLLHRSEVVTAG